MEPSLTIPGSIGLLLSATTCHDSAVSPRSPPTCVRPLLQNTLIQLASQCRSTTSKGVMPIRLVCASN